MTWQFSGFRRNEDLQIYHNKNHFNYLVASATVNGPTSENLYIFFPRPLAPIVSRISGTIVSDGYNGTCKMKIQGVQFEDAGTIIMKVSDRVSDDVLKITSLIVKGKQN